MADEQQDEPMEQDQPKEVLAYVSDRDWFLTSIVKLANMGLGVGITLIVDGAIVSGTLTGGKQYFDQLAADFASAKGPSSMAETVKAISEEWARNGKVYVQPKDADEDWQWPEPGFVHLMNAKIYHPGQPGMPSKGQLWRCKLNAISGFALGSYDPPS